MLGYLISLFHPVNRRVRKALDQRIARAKREHNERVKQSAVERTEAINLALLEHQVAKENSLEQAVKEILG
jgi:hypothetical protein